MRWGVLNERTILNRISSNSRKALSPWGESRNKVRRFIFRLHGCSNSLLASRLGGLNGSRKGLNGLNLPRAAKAPLLGGLKCR